MKEEEEKEEEEKEEEEEEKKEEKKEEEEEKKNTHCLQNFDPFTYLILYRNFVRDNKGKRGLLFVINVYPTYLPCVNILC